MKSHNNKAFEPFLIILLAFCFLLVLSTANEYISKNFKQLKPLHLLSDITYKKEKKGIKTALYTANNKLIISNHKTESTPTQNYIEHTQSLDTLKGLDRFFEALKNIKQKRKVRIAWFGDSMVEGDLITQDLRYLLQKKFGGSGVGIVPLTSITAGFRQTIRHTFSENWSNKNLLEPLKPDDLLGITGYVFNPVNLINSDTININSEQLSWVKYKGVSRRGLDKFYKTRLFYGPCTTLSFVQVLYGNGYQKKITLSGSKKVNSIDITAKEPVSEIQLNFISPNDLSVYALSMESDTGVFVDNLSFRGNSGLPLTKISQQVLNEFDQENNYDLIILQYGMNAVNPEVSDYSWYQKGLSRMIKHIQRGFPKAAILFVGVPDKGYKLEDEYITNPGVPYVVAIEKEISEQNGIAFWNLFEAMGGYNSMVKWTEADTALANKDYTHFNYRGASKVASLLYKDLDKQYQYYLKKTQTTALLPK